ncbi:hypothetical protein CR513_48493, partial [Mucuna pruriens]
MNATIQDLRTQMGQLATLMNQLQSTSSENLPSQTIANPKGNVSTISLRSGKELPQQQPASQPKLKPVNVQSESEADSTVPQLARAVPFPNRKSEPNEELLQMFWKVEINIPLLEAIKQILKYAKFLKELCRNKLKGGVEMGRIISVLIKSEQVTIVTQPAMPAKCQDPNIFSMSCTIDNYTFANTILDLVASINVMSSSIYKSLNCGDLEPMGIIIQLANRSIVHPLGILEDVLVRINELIFSTDFYVLDMEDEPSGKGSTLILGRPFLMTEQTKIDVHAETLSMEFGDNRVQFNIFEVMKHPIKDHSLFGIDIIDELVEDYMQLGTSLVEISNFVETTNVLDTSDSMKDDFDSINMTDTLQTP